VKDAYNGLKTLIYNKFVGKPAAEVVLAQFEEDPDVWISPLEKELKKVGIAQDKNIVDSAQRVMALAQLQQAAQDQYNVQITGNVHNFAEGNHPTINVYHEHKA
jgi:hypothetical protein